MNEEPSTCPFCKSDRVSLDIDIEKINERKIHMGIKCESCGCKGPFTDMNLEGPISESIKKWNKRK